MAVNATISNDSDKAVRMSKALEKQMSDPPRMMGDMNAAREVKFWVYVFNVGPMEHRIARPWAHGGQVIIPACEPGKPFSKPYTIPDVVQEKRFISGSTEFSTVGRDGKFYAQDVLNPDDPQGNWKSVAPINQGLTTNLGTNLYSFGCFWTLANPPEADALEKAKERLEHRFNELLREGNTLHTQKRDAEIGFLHYTAANYFDVKTGWYESRTAKSHCLGCGGEINPGIARCPHCKAVLDEKQCRKLYPEMFAAKA